jgi:hypothetical protein
MRILPVLGDATGGCSIYRLFRYCIFCTTLANLKSRISGQGANQLEE